MKREKRDGQTLAVIEEANQHLSSYRPMTLRHLFYLLVSSGTVQPTKNGYKNLSRIITTARERGEVDYESLVDGLRSSIKPSSWSGLEDFADTVAAAYRKDFWEAQADYVELWFEKDAIVGVVEDITEKYDVKVRPLRGQASATFMYQTAKELARIKKPIHIYYAGDHDPSGYSVEDSALTRLLEMLQSNFGKTYDDLKDNFRWHRIGFNASDFKAHGIRALDVKRNDPNHAKFVAQYGTEAAELDALPPDELRQRVEDSILCHIDAGEWTKLQDIEAMERESFNAVLKQFRN
jgi:hypothetical protein